MINNNWVFGKGAGLDFSNADATTLPVDQSNYPVPSEGIYEGCAAISDANGRLLFYTDGTNIWYNPPANTNNAPNNFVDLMAPPTAFPKLKGDSSSTQSSIIVPDPAHDQRYYIFTTDGSTGTLRDAKDPNKPINPINFFEGHLMDLSGAAPTIAPVVFNNTPSNFNDGISPVEKLVAVQQPNCRDYWVITMVQKGPLDTRVGQGIFRVFSVTPCGVAFEQQYATNQEIDDLGYLKASPDATRLAVATGKQRSVLVYDFDLATGAIDVTSTLTFKPDVKSADLFKLEHIYGVAFSPDSQLLYFSNLSDTRSSNGYIFQVQLNGLAAGSSVLVPLLHRTNVNTVLGALQLGPDGRIYIARQNTKSLGAIMKPNALGAACDVQETAVPLSKISKVGLPNLLPNPCPDSPSKDCDCQSCTGCNEAAPAQNQELIDRTQEKANTIPAQENQRAGAPFKNDCQGKTAVKKGVNFAPHFYFHWGDGPKDQIEVHDTEVFYLTACNPFEDIRYEGMRITSVTLIPDVADLDRLHIVPDRFVHLDCLEPCSCQTREFALITRSPDLAGTYTLEVAYCYEGLALVAGTGSGSGMATFPVEIVKD